MSAWHRDTEEGRSTKLGQALSGGHVHGEDNAKRATDWLIDAAELLERPDPGPTPWLVENLIVDRALVACVGKWKTTKSYVMLDICISVATGRPAFGKLPISFDPDGDYERAGGPVIFVNEESGEDALWRRLDALCRGRGIHRDELRGRLLVAPNRRVKLDDPAWLDRLIRLGLQTGPRLYVFDPLARLKDAARDENAQGGSGGGMAELIENLRTLRDETCAGVAIVHHTGHQGEHMRGTSDLESFWETKLEWKRERQSPDVTIKSEHREAEEGPPLTYRIAWDSETRSMRFELEEDETRSKVADYLAEHPDASANEVYKELKGNRAEILAAVKELRSDIPGALSETGTNRPVPPRNHPLAAPPDGGTQVGLSEPPGTTSRAPGTNGSEPPLEDWAPLDYYETLYHAERDEAAA